MSTTHGSRDQPMTGRSTGPVPGRPPGVEDFDAFVHATGTRLYRTALLLCGEHHLAEDLVQATYTKLFLHWRKVSSATSPAAYARTTLVRTFASHRRLRRTAERPADRLPDAAGPDADPSTRLDLMAALQELGPDDRAVLVLRYWEDLSVADTADLLGIREPACRARASRALARLRTHLPDLEES